MYVYIKMYTPTLVATKHMKVLLFWYNKHIVPYQVSSHACMVSLSLLISPHMPVKNGLVN